MFALPMWAVSSTCSASNMYWHQQVLTNPHTQFQHKLPLNNPIFKPLSTYLEYFIILVIIRHNISNLLANFIIRPQVNEMIFDLSQRFTMQSVHCSFNYKLCNCQPRNSSVDDMHLFVYICTYYYILQGRISTTNHLRSNRIYHVTLNTN